MADIRRCLVVIRNSLLFILLQGVLVEAGFRDVVNLEIGNSTVISSPNFPGKYGNNEHITYFISAPEGYRAEAQFLDFNLGDGDYLNVRSGLNLTEPGSVQLAWLTGNEIPDDVVSPGRTMLIVFSSDESISGTGYRINLTAVIIEPGYREEVNLDIDNPTIITSPNFPYSYGNNRRIEYSITAPEGYRAQARFLDFDLESGYDYLTVRSGSTLTEPGTTELAWLTGTEVPDDILSPGQTMLIIFSSDESTAGTGYRIELAAVEREACSEAEFECTSGLCVSHGKVCDNINDCLDFSDEEFCPLCVDIELQGCRDLLGYTSTIFPNEQVEDSTEAEAFMNGLTPEVLSCHVQLQESLCHVFYPDCPHASTQHGMCRWQCLEVTAACRDIFELAYERDWPLDCGDYSDLTRNDGLCLKSIADPFSTNICGTRPGYSPDQSRVVGGINARPGEFPWMASIRVLNDTRFLCAASILAADWVVTAAHCLHGYSDSIVVGDLIISNATEYHQSIDPYDIYVYPGYGIGASPVHGDLALIRLAEPIEFNDYVRPICPPQGLYTDTTYRRCQIMGWGTTHEEDTMLSDALQKATVEILDIDYCNETYDSIFTETMMCAGNRRGGIGTCTADSGAPLACQADDERWYLVGVSSADRGCGREDYPSVYTRVGALLPFINDVVNGEYTGNVYEVSLEATSAPVVIQSPNYPDNYPNNSFELYRITAPDGYSVRVDVADLSLEDGYDYIFFGDGPVPVSETEIARFSTSEDGVTPTVTSSGSVMWIKFNSDTYVTDRGFSLEVIAVPDEDESNDISVDVGEVSVISSPNYPGDYNNNDFMVWRITAPPGYSVRSHFNDFEVQEGDLLRIGFGLSPFSQTSEQFLSGSELPGDLTSPGRFLFVVFSTTATATSRGFQMELTVELTEAIDECASDPCRNGGTCTDLVGSYQCSCLDGLKGGNCEIDLDECASSPCLNGATCADGVNSFSCQCAPGFEGETCAEVIFGGACGWSPCMNSGTCVTSGNNEYICECRSGYVGERCEIDINECSSLPCQNGGRCLDGPGMYTCQCRPGYTGQNCQKVGYCDLDGEWYNECNDKLTLETTSTGLLLGGHMTQEDILIGASVPKVVVGYANKNCEVPSFGLVMGQNEGLTTTSWTGQCLLCGGQEVLYTIWTSTQKVDTCAERKRATRVGRDKWTRYKQDLAPKEEETRAEGYQSEDSRWDRRK